jgi:hypothetical protein
VTYDYTAPAPDVATFAGYLADRFSRLAENYESRKLPAASEARYAAELTLQMLREFAETPAIFRATAARMAADQERRAHSISS